MSRSRLITAGIAGAAALGGLLVWQAVTVPAGDGVPALDAGDAQLVALGQQVYRDNCASCHGAVLEGEADWRRPKANGRMPAPPHDQSGHTWHHDDGTLFRLTKYGLASLMQPGSTYESDMPAYEGVLSDREIAAALAYIKSTWPDDIQAAQADIPTR